MNADYGFLERFIANGEEPVFAQPWEARAFALAVQLHSDGHFTWPEFSQALAKEISANAEDSYYCLWLRALERIVVDKRIVDAQDVRGVADTTS